MPAHESRSKRQEVPLGAGSLEHLDGIDADLVEDERQLVHERDVEVALGVLDDLRGLGDLDAARAVDARAHDAAVEAPRSRSSVSGVSPDTTFVIVVNVCSRSPGLIRSGEYPTKKSRFHFLPEWRSIAGTQISSVAPG
jgi:hypothetical protein